MIFTSLSEFPRFANVKMSLIQSGVCPREPEVRVLPTFLGEFDEALNGRRLPFVKGLTGKPSLKKKQKFSLALFH